MGKGGISWMTGLQKYLVVKSLFWLPAVLSASSNERDPMNLIYIEAFWRVAGCWRHTFSKYKFETQNSQKEKSMQGGLLREKYAGGLVIEKYAGGLLEKSVQGGLLEKSMQGGLLEKSM